MALQSEWWSLGKAKYAGLDEALMAVAGNRIALIAVLIAVGLYFLVFHRDPLPLNHEAIGLGTGDLHIVHDVIGLILIGGSVLIWRKSRTVTTPMAPSQPAK